MAGVRIETALRHSEEDLSCAVCLDALHLPAALPCGHAFCSSCVVRSTAARSGVGACPVCRARFDRLPRPCAALCALVQAARPAEAAARQADADAAAGPQLAPAAAPRDGLGAFARLLECGRCAGPVRTPPRCLPCGHLLCEACCADPGSPAGTVGCGDGEALFACTACGAAPAPLPHGVCSILGTWLASGARPPHEPPRAPPSTPPDVSTGSVHGASMHAGDEAGAAAREAATAAARRVGAREAEAAFRASRRLLAESGAQAAPVQPALSAPSGQPLVAGQPPQIPQAETLPAPLGAATSGAPPAVRSLRGCDGCGLLPALADDTRAAAWGPHGCTLFECVECAEVARCARDTAAAAAGAPAGAAAEPSAEPAAARREPAAQPYGLCAPCAEWEAERASLARAAAPPLRRPRALAGRFGPAVHVPGAHTLRPVPAAGAAPHAGWASAVRGGGARERAHGGAGARTRALHSALRGVLARAVGEFASRAAVIAGPDASFERLAALAHAEAAEVGAAGTAAGRAGAFARRTAAAGGAGGAGAGAEGHSDGLSDSDASAHAGAAGAPGAPPGGGVPGGARRAMDHATAGGTPDGGDAERHGRSEAEEEAVARRIEAAVARAAALAHTAMNAIDAARAAAAVPAPAPPSPALTLGLGVEDAEEAGEEASEEEAEAEGEAEAEAEAEEEEEAEAAEAAESARVDALIDLALRCPTPLAVGAAAAGGADGGADDDDDDAFGETVGCEIEGSILDEIVNGLPACQPDEPSTGLRTGTDMPSGHEWSGSGLFAAAAASGAREAVLRGRGRPHLSAQWAGGGESAGSLPLGEEERGSLGVEVQDAIDAALAHAISRGRP